MQGIYRNTAVLRLTQIQVCSIAAKDRRENVEDMEKELLKAERNSYFGVLYYNHTSRMWNEILEILKKKLNRALKFALCMTVWAVS